MMCLFTKTQHEWICKTCGRRVSYKDQNNEHIQPSAKCRIPDSYIINQKNIYNRYKKRYNGVGYILLDIAKNFNLNFDSLSTAKLKADKMDSNGIEWCESNIETICDWIREECEARNIQYIKKLSISLIKLAIKKSKYNRSLILFN